VEVREPDPPPPPRFVLFRTSEDTLPLVGASVPEALASQLLALAATEPPRPEHAPLRLARYRTLLGDHREIEREYAGPSLYLPGPLGAADGVEKIEAHNLGLLHPNFPEEARDFEARRPIYAVLEDGVAVAICFSSRDFGRGTPCGVFTVEAHRGRGHAGRVVLAWAAEVARLGSVPLYGTTWDNAASRAIAARLGAVALGSDFWIR
ncbi:MAG: GNAT family N-acetyltransferase, partial [Phenylobacterium sp.]